MLLLSELWAGTPRRIPRPDYLLYALQRRQRKSAYSSVSSPVSGSTTIWPSVTQPSLQAWGRSSWSSWWGAAVKGSPAGGILLMSTVASLSGCGPEAGSAGTLAGLNDYLLEGNVAKVAFVYRLDGLDRSVLLRLRHGHDGLPVEHRARNLAGREILLRLHAGHEHELYEVLFLKRRVSVEEVVAIIGFGQGTELGPVADGPLARVFVL